MGIRQDYLKFEKRMAKWITQLPLPLKESRPLLYEARELIEKYAFTQFNSKYFPRLVNAQKDICALLENG